MHMVNTFWSLVPVVWVPGPNKLVRDHLHFMLNPMVYHMSRSDLPFLKSLATKFFLLGFYIDLDYNNYNDFNDFNNYLSCYNSLCSKILYIKLQLLPRIHMSSTETVQRCMH